MKRVLTLVSLFCLFYITSCTKKDKPAAPLAVREKSEAATPGDGSNNLQFLYATSINLPHGKNGPEKLFDNNSATGWKTMAGAGIDEGVFAQFEKTVYVSSVALKYDQGGANVPLLVKLYINGVETKAYDPALPIPVKQYIRTFYLRLIKVKDSSMSAAPVGLSDIVFLDNSGNELKVEPPLQLAGQILPSSSLEPVEAYNADFLFDSRKDFGWSEGNAGTSGIGETLTFTFDKKVTIKELMIWNGYQRSEEHYKANGRLRAFTFAAADGKGSASYELDDALTGRVTLKEALESNSFTLTVSDVYEGSKYKDMVISEMRFYDGSKWFVVNTGGEEKRKSELLTRAESSEILSKLVDRRLSAVAEDETLYQEQSLIIRSNGSFILWMTSDTAEMNQTVYADGNWQLVDDSKIKIFGRMHTIELYEDMEEVYSPYAGPTENSDSETKENVDSVKIFNDHILVEGNSVTSGKELFLPFTLVE